MSSLCLVTAVPMTVKAFLARHIESASRHWDVTVVTGGEAGALEHLSLHAHIARVPIERAVSPWRDCRALHAIWRLCRARRFSIVHSITPKAGLLAMLAARLAGVPVRVHTFTGQVWCTRTGIRRWVLKSADRVTAANATHLLADSAGQQRFLIDEGVVPARKLTVLGAGSVSGVDTDRFKPDAAERQRVRAGLGIEEGAVVFLFLGRLHREKGITELREAFTRVRQAGPDAWLLLVGPREDVGRAEQLDRDPRVLELGASDQPHRYVAAADVLVLPSHREGFGTVVIEAASAGVPAIGTRIYGLEDAIVDGVTGRLVPVRDVPALAEAMLGLAREPDVRAAYGKAARERARALFSATESTRMLMSFYGKILSQAGMERGGSPS